MATTGKLTAKVLWYDNFHRKHEIPEFEEDAVTTDDVLTQDKIVYATPAPGRVLFGGLYELGGAIQYLFVQNLSDELVYLTFTDKNHGRTPTHELPANGGLFLSPDVDYSENITLVSTSSNAKVRVMIWYEKMYAQPT